jgi:hypothetical protein
VTVLLDTEVHVHYRFLWLTPADEPGTAGDATAGQENGLCGAAVPGALMMVTGLHTGAVPVRVEALEVAPPLDDTWEEIVEVSFCAPDRSCVLSAFQEFHELSLPQAGDLRARWSARGMDAASRADTRVDDEPALDAYLLQLWPADPAPDAILRQTSGSAAYWHRVARESAPPPSADERAQRVAGQQDQLEREAQAQQAESLLESWGGRLPSTRVLALEQSRAWQLGDEDRRLRDVLAALDDETLRRLTAWVCRMSCRHAGLEDLDWVSPTLSALEQGAPLPPPFNDSSAVWNRLYAHWDPSSEGTELEMVMVDNPSPRTALDPGAAALDAVLSTAVDDPLQAAIDAIVGAACCYTDPTQWYDEVARYLS